MGKICWRRDKLPTPVFLGFPCGSAGKESACNAGDMGSIPELGRSPGEGKGYLLQYSGLENPWTVTKIQTWLSNFHLLTLLLSVFSSIRVFSNELAVHIRWPKYWSFSISPSNEYSGLISFRIDWVELLADQGTLKSLLQHHNSEASILWCWAFFTVQFSHPYMTTEKTIALRVRTFVNKVMSLLFNILSRFIIAFLLRGKHLLISWLYSLSTSLLSVFFSK